MGRLRATPKRDVRGLFMVRLNQRERRELAEKAAEAGMSRAAFIRHLVRQYPTNQRGGQS